KRLPSHGPRTGKGLIDMDPQATDDRSARRRRRRRGIVALLATVSLLTIGAGSVSLAQFTDSTTSTWSFTTGTIDISTNPAVLTSITAMMPGDTNTQALTVTNAGTADLRYALSNVGTISIGTQLHMNIYT